MADLTTEEAARFLNVNNPNTIQNWLKGGSFPGAHKNSEGNWLFPLESLREVWQYLEELREKNQKGDLTPADSEEVAEPPLL